MPKKKPRQVFGPVANAADDARYQAEDDLRTLGRMHELMQDGKRVAAAQKMAVEKAKEAQKLPGILSMMRGKKGD